MNGPTVLIVDDDEVIRDVLEELLQYQGYRTLAAQHGGEAIQKLEEIDCPALLIMDLMMPVMSGWELLARLREQSRWSALPVIILSAGGEAPKGLLSDPHVRFLRKPVRMNSLMEAVKALA